MPTKKDDKPTYAYTAGVGKMADDKFDIEGANNSKAEMRFSDEPDQKAMRYMAADEKLSEFLNPKAGAGRGKQGGPTAKELADYERKQDAGIYTAEKGKPPQDKDGASVSKKAKGGMTAKFMSFSKKGKPAGMKSVTKMASGGMTASSRADGCATKGKTRGKMV